MLIQITLTRAQAAGLAELAGFVEADIEVQIPDGRRRASAERGLSRLRDAIGRGKPLPIDEDLEALADAIGDFSDSGAVALFAGRVRDLLAYAVIWRGLEHARSALRRRGDAVDQFDALLEPSVIDDVDWRADALDLLAAVGHTVRLPDEV